MGQEFRQLSQVVLAQGLSKGVVKTLEAATVIWRLVRGGEMGFQDGSFMWLLAGGFSPSPRRPVHRAASILMTWQPTFPRISDPTAEEGRNHDIFHDLSSEVTICHWCIILLLHRSALLHVREDYKITWIPEGREYWGSSWRLVTTEWNSARMQNVWQQHGSMESSHHLPPPSLADQRRLARRQTLCHKSSTAIPGLPLYTLLKAMYGNMDPF